MDALGPFKLGLRIFGATFFAAVLLAIALQIFFIGSSRIVDNDVEMRLL